LKRVEFKVYPNLLESRELGIVEARVLLQATRFVWRPSKFKILES